MTNLLDSSTSELVKKLELQHFFQDASSVNAVLEQLPGEGNCRRLRRK